MPSHLTDSEGTWDINKLGLGLTRAGLGFGSDLSDAAGGYSSGTASAWSKQLGAQGLKNQAKMHAYNAGEIQREGWDRAVLRYDELRRQISGQRTTAAGSGIDLSSRTVARAETSSRVGAKWDVDQYSRTAQAKSFAETMNAMNARINSAYAAAEAKYAKAAANSSLIGGIVGGLGRFAGGIAGALGASYTPGANGYTLNEDQVRDFEFGSNSVSSMRSSQMMDGWGA